jgi:hypothetical protein
MIVGLVIAAWLAFHFVRSHRDKSYISTMGEDDSAARFALLELY